MRLAALSRPRFPLAGGWQPRWRDLRRWGLPGLMATLLAAVAAWLLLIELPRGAAQLRVDEAHWRQARQDLAAAGAARAAPAADPASRFQSAFPPALDRHRRIEGLLAMATVMGLQPRRSDVRDAAAGASGLMRVRVTMPLTGPYENLRRYVDLALREDSALTLDLLRIERSDPSQPELRAELQWSLWMRPPPGDLR